VTAEQLALEADRTCRLAVEHVQRVMESADSVPSLKEVKRVLSAAQRDLRDVKRRLTEEERELKLQTQQVRRKIAGQGQVLGLFVGSRGRGALSHGRASQRQSLARREASAITPYRNVKAAIDRQINQLQHQKDVVDTELAQRGPASRSTASRSVTAASKPVAETQALLPPPPAPPPPPPTPAVWAPDRYNRHELRYWDGTRWTEHVSDRGDPGIDPA
jgi:Protein of unknown function (DUF2510)